MSSVETRVRNRLTSYIFHQSSLLETPAIAVLSLAVGGKGGQRLVGIRITVLFVNVFAVFVADSLNQPIRC